jgi:XTP/dITP diphosphohydrolase
LVPGRLLAATHNAGKVTELKALFEPHGFDVVSAIDLGLDEPEETETTFAGNALLKARAAMQASGLPALSDDSGLAVTALGGEPGIYSARWAGEPRDFYRAMERVEKALQASGSADRSAKFVCALAVAWPDGSEAVFEGEVHGSFVGAVDALVDLGGVETPCLERQRHMAVAVVVVVERRAVGLWVEHAQSDHRIPPL